MWWETVLIALVPSLVTMVVTNWFNKRKHTTEVDNLVIEGKSAENKNMQLILETYKVTLDQYKTEIEDVNKRFTEYIKQANKRAEINKKKLESLNKRLEDKNDKIQVLEKKVDVMIKDACFIKGCSKRVYLSEKGNE